MRVKIATRIIAGGYLAIAVWVICSLEPTVPADGPNVAVPSPVVVRIVAKTVVARELLTGRLSLSEATAVFDWLNRQPPALTANDARASAGFPPEEFPSRAVLNWIEEATGGEPLNPRGSQIYRRWEDELQSQARSPLKSPSVIEDDCRELLERARAGIRPDSGCASDWVTIEGLRLVEGRRD
jgi:hypothetical protein